MKRAIIINFLLSIVFCNQSLLAETFLVSEGVAQAEIVISENPPRMLALAALELQYYLEKISGARLPIVTEPGGESSVKIYVGTSKHTSALGITDEGLTDGAFRMVSGVDWMVLLGHDSDYNPDQREPWGRKHSDRPRAQADWDELTLELADRIWGHPFANIFKGWWNNNDYDSFMSERYGSENRDIWNPRNLNWTLEYQGQGAGAGFWLQDKGGSLNAVYEFLRSLGTRWYMPGQIGEVVPEQKTIILPSFDKTVHPDFDVRSYTWYNYSGFSFEDIIWARRTGMNSANEVLGDMGYAHGITLVHSRTEMKVAHPEYYALIDGVRDTTYRGRGSACFSSEGLMHETIKFASFMYDQYDQPHVSIWPGDGYKQCQCDSCKGKSASELVWGFVDKVARELYESHPDRLISCGAYTPYKDPPGTVDEFTPNLVVFISGEGRPMMDNPTHWASYMERVESWQERITPGNIMRVENNRYSLWHQDYDKPIPYPVIHPRAMAKDLQALKGISRGECSEESQIGSKRWYAPGVDHLALWVQSRFFWDATQDVDTLLEEYYTLFYGPAREEMKIALEFAEANYSRTDQSRNGGKCDPRNVDLWVKVQLLEYLHAARDMAGETVYGQRILTIIDELPPLDSLRPPVFITAVDRTTGDPVYGATVNYGESTQETDNSGRIHIDSLSSGTKLIYTIDHSDYFPITDSIVFRADTSLLIPMTKKPRVLLTVVDRTTGDPVTRAVIYYNEDQIGTNNSGQASIVFNGLKCVFSVEHKDYFVLNDSVIFNSDSSLVISLTSKLASIRFEITDASGPLAGAPVSLNGWEIQTNTNGMASFRSQPAREEYIYTIDMEGYQTLSDTLFLEIDTTISVMLQPALGIKAYTSMEAVVFPNPASGKLYIRTEQGNASATILNLEGKVILERMIEKGMSMIDVAGYTPGLYFLRIQTGKLVTYRKVVLQ